MRQDLTASVKLMLMSVPVKIIIIIIIIIIITLFQEDNIFDTDASLTYCPQLTNVDMLLK